jgi:serine/threonine-protein kinase
MQWLERLRAGSIVGPDTAALDTGRIRCTSCRREILFAIHPPLSLQRCPSCNDLFFVPMHVGDWWTVQPLAAGGFGAVYLAVSHADQSVLAASKVLRRTPDLPTGAIEDFLHEAAVLEAVQPHPGVPKLYDHGELDIPEAAAILIMEFLDGTRLDHLTENARNGRLPAEEALYYMLDLASSLAHLHARGMVFRDLKPDNVMVRPDHRAMLMDFGLCRPLDQTRRRPDEPLMGTPLLMPPERIEGRPEDARSDVYALGLTLYATLTGRHYFTGDEVMPLLKAHTRNLRLPTRIKMQGVDDDLVQLVDGMIQRAPEDRFPDCAAVAETAQPILERLRTLPAPNAAVARRRKTRPSYTHPNG